jgi:hypothetical protein
MYQPPGEYKPSVFYGCISDDASKVHILGRDFGRPYIYKITNQNDL